MVVKESGGGEMPYGTAVEGSFGAAGVNGEYLSSFCRDFRVKKRKMTDFSKFSQSAPIGEFRWYRAIAS